MIKYDNLKQKERTVSANPFFSFQSDFDTETRNVMVEGLQYHLTDLYEFTEYTFWVSAFNANGEGILSEEIAARFSFLS